MYARKRFVDDGQMRGESILENVSCLFTLSTSLLHTCINWATLTSMLFVPKQPQSIRCTSGWIKGSFSRPIGFPADA